MLNELSKGVEHLNYLYKLIGAEINFGEALESDITELLKITKAKQETIIEKNNNKIQQIRMKQTEEDSNIFIEDDFKDENNIVKNEGFRLISEMSAITLNPEGVKGVGYDQLIVAENNSEGNGSVTYDLAGKNDISSVNVLFKDLNGVMITPAEILYRYENDQGSLLEEFERFFDRHSSDESNIYYFYAKKVEKVTFVFDRAVEEIDIDNSLVAFYLEEFNTENELVLKYKNNSTAEKIKITKNFYDRLGTIKCLISNDNDDYQEISFENNRALINNPKNEFIYLKLKQETVINNTAKEDQKENGREDHSIKVKYEVDENFVELLAIENFIDLSTLKLVLPFSVAKQLKEKNDVFVSAVEARNFIASDFVEVVEKIEDSKIDLLEDLDSSEAIENINKPCFFIDKSCNRLYYPSFMSGENLAFRVEFQEILFQEILSEKTYTPFFFDLYIEE